MPSNLMTLETGFPTFTGEEPAEQQILAMHNYLFQLREGLLYSLSNLTTENFNATALENMTAAQKDAMSKQLTQVYNALNELSTRVNNISGRVAGSESGIAAAESEIDRLSERVGTNESNITSVQKTVSETEAAMGDLGDRVEKIEDELPLFEQTAADLEALEGKVDGQGQTIQKIASAVTAAEDGSITIGKPGQFLNLVGTVYINGVLYEQGGTT